MCVCMYVYMHVCMHDMYVCMFVCMYVCRVNPSPVESCYFYNARARYPMADFNDPLRGALRSIKSSVTTKTPFTVCFLFNKKDQPDRVLRRSSNRGRYRGGGRALL